MKAIRWSTSTPTSSRTASSRSWSAARRSSATWASGCARCASCSTSTCASRTWTRSARTTGRSSRCPIRRSRTSPRARSANNLARVANDSMAELCRQASRPVSGVRRGGVDARRRFLDRRGRARHQDGRTRRADLHQHRRPSARRAALPAVLRGDGRRTTCRSGCIRRAPRRCRTTPPSRARASRCGGASAGPTRPRSRCAGWCSTASTTGIRSSRSSPTISAAA